MLTNASKKIILMMSLLASTAMLISCGEDDGATTPTDPDPATVNAGFTSEVDLDNSFTYNFTNTTVIFGIEDLTGTYAWDFGGDGVSDEKDPSYTFTEAGTFEVTLTATAADGTVGTASETITVTAPKNKWAVIADLSADDTGELRLSLPDSIRNGRLTFVYRVPEGAADGFIHVAGNSTTGDFAIMEVRIKDDAQHEFREGADDAAIAAGAANFPTGTTGTWIPVEISWSANGTDAPTWSLSMDGVTIVTDAVSTTNGGDGDVADHLAATKDGAHSFLWKYNSTSSTSDLIYEVDDIVIYSSDSGTEMEAFSDDFQGYQTGTNLNPGEDEANPTTSYHINTSEATVAEEQ